MDHKQAINGKTPIKRGDVFVEGIDIIIKRDLEKHIELLNNNNLDIQAFEVAVASEIGRKRSYGKQKKVTKNGKLRYDPVAMDKAIVQMNVNIRHLSDRIKITKELRQHNTIIVDTLTAQLNDYNNGLRLLSKHRKEQLDNANST